MATEEIGREEMTDAYCAGRRVGFGISAMVLSLLAMVSLLGAEKAILAIVLGALALRGSGRGTLARRLGLIAICIGAVFLLVVTVVVIVFRDQLLEIILTLEKLS